MNKWRAADRLWIDGGEEYDLPWLIRHGYVEKRANRRPGYGTSVRLTLKGVEAYNRLSIMAYNTPHIVIIDTEAMVAR